MKKLILILMLLGNTGFGAEYMYLFNGIKTSDGKGDTDLLITANCDRVKGTLKSLISVEDMIKRVNSKMSMPFEMKGKMKGLIFLRDDGKAIARIWFYNFNICDGFVNGFKKTSKSYRVLKRKGKI